jgi:hypothetical protein
MKKSIQIIVAILLIATIKTKGQGLHGGLTTGSIGIVGLELGYSVSESLHAGISYHPKMNTNGTGTAGYFGVYGRKCFKESELFSIWTMRTYLTATIGIINPPTDSYIDLSNINNINQVSTSNKKSVGGAIGGGFEILFGRSGKIATPLEIGLGRMPNALSSLSYDPYNSNSTNSSRFTSAFYFKGGLRFYLSK